MGLRLLAASPILDRKQLVRERKPLGRGPGHVHFWQRAAAHSRRGFLQAGATLAGRTGDSVHAARFCATPFTKPDSGRTRPSRQRPYFSCVSTGNLA